MEAGRDDHPRPAFFFRRVRPVQSIGSFGSVVGGVIGTAVGTTVGWGALAVAIVVGVAVGRGGVATEGAGAPPRASKRAARLMKRDSRRLPI